MLLTKQIEVWVDFEDKTREKGKNCGFEKICENERSQNSRRSWGFELVEKIRENAESQNLTPLVFSRIFSTNQNPNFVLNFDSLRFRGFSS